MANELYIPDFDTNFKYARFGTNYIDLFNSETLQPNREYTYYRYYLYDNIDLVVSGTYSKSSYSTVEILPELKIYSNNDSNKEIYHKDISNVFVMFFVVLFISLLGLKLFSRAFMKNGGIF